jgi:hypothetical protein
MKNYIKQVVFIHLFSFFMITLIIVFPPSLTKAELSVTQPEAGDFQSVVLNGHTQQTNASFGSFEISNSNTVLNNNGWHVTIQASQFSTGGEVPLLLPLNSLHLAAPTSINRAPLSDNDVNITAVNGGEIDNATGLKMLSANSGKGNYTINFPANALTLTLKPAFTKIEPSGTSTFSTTITVSIHAGP